MKQAATLMSIILFSLMNSKIMAADEDFCTDYVLTSIEQYWRNVNHECGFTGKRWNANYKGQYRWCLSASPWIAENENREREVLLQTCKQKQTEPQSSSPQLKSPATVAVNDAFLRAVNANDIEKVKQLVEQGADIHFQTQDMALIQELGLSYQKQSSSVVKTKTAVKIVGKNDINDDISDDISDVNEEAESKSTEGVTVVPTNESIVEPTAESALSFAVAKGLADVGLWLLAQQQHILPKKQQQYYRSVLLGNALITAVKQEKGDLVRDLLNKGASVDYELDGNSGNALYFAVMKGSQEITRLLLEHQADPNYTTNAGESLLNSVLNNLSLLALLLDYKADPNRNGEATNKSSLPIVRAVEMNNSKAVELLMQHGATADVYDYELPYPLITAIKREQITMIRVLLKYGANPNVIYNKTSPENCVQGERNLSPFSVALETKNKRVIALLAKAKSIEVLCPTISATKQ